MPSRYNFSNLSRFTLSADLDASSTSVSLTSVTDPPAVPFRALVHDQKYPNPADDPNAELVEVTTAGASPWTVVRGKEGDASSHTGSTFFLTPVLSAEFANMLAASVLGTNLLGCPAAAVAGADMENESISISSSGTTLTFRVKDSGGTVREGTVGIAPV